MLSFEAGQMFEKCWSEKGVWEGQDGAGRRSPGEGPEHGSMRLF